MSLKNYLMVNKSTSIVDNICLWDGNVKTWNPTDAYTMLEQDVTPAEFWRLNKARTDYELVTMNGFGQIGFSYNGEKVITNQPKPSITE